MIGIVDLKISNIFSVANMLQKVGARYKIINSKDDFNNLSKLILPGVGAFPKAIDNLKKYDLFERIISFVKGGNFLLGICLGMQLLFSESEEFEIVTGLDLINGPISKIHTELTLPHMGWNSLNILGNNSLTKDLSQSANVYFVHSYKASCDTKHILATALYGESIPAIVNKENIYGCQFHPEKSQKWGEIIIKNFMNL